MKKTVSFIVPTFIVALTVLLSGCGASLQVSGPGAQQMGSAGEREFTASDTVTIFANSEVKYDDKIGFEEYPLVEDENTTNVVDGIIRRRFCQAPEGRSPLEIIRYYQNAIEDLGGTIIFQTRDPRSIEIEGESLIQYFNKTRQNRGMSTYVWDFYRFPRSISEYLAAKLTHNGKDMYIAIAAGRGAGGAEYSGVRFEIVTVE